MLRASSRARLRLELQEVDPSKVIAAALDVVRPAAEAKQIDLVADLDTTRTTVSADPARLQQVIWNLLSNAIKFTPEGGHVEIRSRRVDSDIEIVVADTGKGSARISCPTYSTGSGKTMFRPHAHTEVSASVWPLYEHLVELHGGTVFAESVGKGKGATFTVRLPIRVVRTNRQKVEGRKEGPESQRDLRRNEKEILKGLRVLVVEDDSEDREVLLAELAHHGAT